MAVFLPSFRNHGKDLMEEGVLQSVKSLLHSLSPRNYQEIKYQLKKCISKCPSLTLLLGLLDSIVEMALVKEVSSLLGRLCSEFGNEIPPIVDEASGEKLTFRRLLLNKLQMEFETTVSEVSGDEQRLRPRFVGNVRLLAQLFTHKMLADKICHVIIQKLLEPAEPPEMHVEAVCEFCDCAGKLLDGRNLKSREMLDGYFKRLKDLAGHPRRTEELRVMIHQLLHIRSNNWVRSRAAGSNHSLSYATSDMDSSSEDEDEFEDVFEQLEKTMNKLKTSQDRARKHRLAAEVEASNVKHKTGELERKYNEEFKRREEAENALARGREELEKTKQELDSKYNEELRRREEAEYALVREREELESTKQELEICKKERDGLQVERDNALKLTEDLLRNKEEETSLLTFVHSKERQTPESFVCPISQEVMKDPHVAADGFTYEGEAIRSWLDSGLDTSPMTNLQLSHRILVPNHTLRTAIEEWLEPVRSARPT